MAYDEAGLACHALLDCRLFGSYGRTIRLTPGNTGNLVNRAGLEPATRC